MSCGLQVWILFRAGDSDAPHLTPRLVQVAVNGIDAGVVRRYGIAPVDWNAV